VKRTFLIAAAFVGLSAGLVRAQFGFGITVFDPTNWVEAINQLRQLEAQYRQLVQTYMVVRGQYDHMINMARRIPVAMATRYRAALTPWRYPSATNTYGTTGGWMAAVNSGLSVATGYFESAERLLAYGAAMGNVPADQRDRLMKRYATVELTDGANQHGIEAVGALRRNALAVETAIQGLEDDSLSADPNYNTEVGVLNKINAATVIALRNGQDTNKLLVSLAEQQVVDSKRRRDAEVKAINTHILLMRDGRGVIDAQSSSWTAELLGYRL
jgi:hypothetical protein